MRISFIRRTISNKMSQKRITTFFKTSDNSKRKSIDSDDENSASFKVSKKSVRKPFLVTTETISLQIQQIATINPALSANIGQSWFLELKKEFSESYFKQLGNFLKDEKTRYTIYPPANEVYSWTNSVEIYDVKIVILGQDPYIRPNQAHGLAFSVRKGVGIPKSLHNIYQELLKDIPGFIVPSHGCLNGWASQGVLLLNTCLTVRAGHSDSHKGRGWEKFTDAVIKWIDQNLSHVVFLLWGNNAKTKSEFITKDKHLVLTAAHPSPLSASRGYFGCHHFSKANEYLRKHHQKEVDWKYLP